ncbi:hypothetical protein [Wenjunlia tyrosinilytica]|uniref:hypothetical protein n=1 Tax=Wenjunlia tyrosinilytica TaxID=1544741 RepID=UPI00357152AD
MTGEGAMESGPAVFAGAVFSLFGAGLLAWSGARWRLRSPVVQGAGAGAAALCVAAGTAFLVVGFWCLTSV